MPFGKTKGVLLLLSFPYCIMPSLLILRSSRLWCLGRQPIVYDKKQTASEKQNISTKMRYSQLVNSGANRSTIKGQLVRPTVIPLTN